MRKRIIIGLLAVVVISVGAYLLRPEPDTIAYHKEHYLSARDGTPIMKELRNFQARVTGRSWHRMSGNKMARHSEALLRLGYWQEQTVTVSNRNANDVWAAATQKGARGDLSKEICVVILTDSNNIIVRAVPEHMPIWTELIRDADVPETRQ